MSAPPEAQRTCAVLELARQSRATAVPTGTEGAIQRFYETHCARDLVPGPWPRRELVFAQAGSPSAAALRVRAGRPGDGVPPEAGAWPWHAQSSAALDVVTVVQLLTGARR